ncbi:MAG: formyltransferase family protein [Betaproteobacteria bacterium]
MDSRYIFVGNRRFVLEQMLYHRVNLVATIVIAGTHLERDISGGVLPALKDHTVVSSKSELIELLKQSQFDVLVSNGCPYILPVMELPKARYVNIHPSCLPDLRGADPAIGALLFKRDTGATCHVMDAGIDTGPIISQIRIPYSDDLDVTTVYQLSFIAEKKVFSDALERSFEPQLAQADYPNIIYYTRKSEDQFITFAEPNEQILQKVKAFNNRSQGCKFIVNGVSYRVFSAKLMHNTFLFETVSVFPECVIALSYEGGIVFKKDGAIIRFEDIVSSDGKPLNVGDELRNE